MLLDRGLVKYINKFTIRMQAPVTQEELDRRDNKRNKVGVINDIMQQLGEIQNPVIKLKILKSLLADSLTDVSVIELLQQQIDEIEKSGVTEGAEDEEKPEPQLSTPVETPEPQSPEPEQQPEETPAEETTETPAEDEESYLPSPEELGVDLTVNK
jgi:hypothetical protein